MTKMATPRKSISSNNSDTIRQQANHYMMKLSDRDTEAMAFAELDALARSLAADAIPTFISAISDARPTDKPSLRRQSLRILAILAAAHSPASIAPHLHRMLAAALRRLRDPDSSVRAACVDAVRSIAAVAAPNAVAVLRPVADALIHEQDAHAQSAAALALAAAIDVNVGVEIAGHVQRLVPRLLKLYRSKAFKAKAALLAVLGSAAAAGGVGTPTLLGLVVPCLVESLSSENWAVRKAGAEALLKLAVTEKGHLVEFRSSCLSVFEMRRFDKVKIVRDSMNKMMDVWKDIPQGPEEETNVAAAAAAKSSSNRSSRDNVSDARYLNASVGSSSVPFSSPFLVKKNKVVASRSPPPTASPVPAARKHVTSVRNKILSPPLSQKNDRKPADWIDEITVFDTPIKVASGEKIQNVKEPGVGEGGLIAQNYEEKQSKLTVAKTVSRVVPLQENGTSDLTAGNDINVDEIQGGQKEGDISMIKMQLMQIENQQSSILDLLQKFTANSQNGIHSLETRVHGLEKALGEISRDFPLSGRPYNDHATSTCCRLPGAEFLSPKFWRKTEGRYSSRLSISDVERPTERPRKSFKWGKDKYGIHGAIVTNPLAEINPPSGASTDVSSSTILKNIIHDRVTPNRGV